MVGKYDQNVEFDIGLDNWNVDFGIEIELLGEAENKIHIAVPIVNIEKYLIHHAEPYQCYHCK